MWSDGLTDRLGKGGDGDSYSPIIIIIVVTILAFWESCLLKEFILGLVWTKPNYDDDDDWHLYKPTMVDQNPSSGN